MTGTIAVLNNVTRLAELTSMLVNRQPGLPGFGVYSGPAGRGKSFAALYCVNKFNGYYVEVDSTMTQKDFIEALMIELGLLPQGKSWNRGLHKGVKAIGEMLADNPMRPLFIDEADLLVHRKKIELVRDIYKKCADAGTSIIMLGEENLPMALGQWERIYSRVLNFAEAEALSIDDINRLAQLVVKDIEFDKAAIDEVSRQIKGSARRAVTMFYRIKEQATLEGIDQITVETLKQLLEG